MRLLMTLAIFLLGLALTAAGVINQIENRPISSIETQYRELANEPHILVPNRLLTAYTGNPRILVEGSGEFTVIQSRESDIRAWLAGLEHRELRLVVDAAQEQAQVSSIPRGGDDVANPIGSDTWALELTDTARISYEIAVNNETALLLSRDGTKPASVSLTLSWQLPPVDYPVAPIIYIGLTIMWIGAAAALLLFILARRRMGPRRVRPAKRPVSKRSSSRTRTATFGIPLITALTLSGCAVEYENPILSPSPAAAPDVLTAAVTVDQAERILAAIATSIAQADEALNRELLEERVAGPAFAMRAAAYNLARRSEEIAPPDRILSEPVQLVLPTATDAWPRHILVATGSPPETPLQMLVLRQETVRDPYQLWHYSELLPDVEFPDVAAADQGAVSLRPDNRFLAFPVDGLVDLVGDVLNNWTNSSYTNVVDINNPYLRSVSQVQRDLVATLDNAEITFEHLLADETFVVISTIDGGALAALYMHDLYEISPLEAGDAVAISGPEALLLGTSGSTTGVRSRYGAMLMFYIPGINSNETMRLVGATQQLLGVSALG